MHFRRCVGGYVLDVTRKPRTPKLFLECYCVIGQKKPGRRQSPTHSRPLSSPLCKVA